MREVIKTELYHQAAVSRFFQHTLENFHNKNKFWNKTKYVLLKISQWNKYENQKGVTEKKPAIIHK